MTSLQAGRPAIHATTYGGPTTLLEIAGLRVLTDPTFDPPGEYSRGSYSLHKTTPPAAAPPGPVDLVLLSHDQHPDNLDAAGRALLPGAGRVLTTVAGAGRLGGYASPMPRWSHVDVPAADGGTVRVTSVPAQHGPDGTDHITGEVTGFVLTGDNLPVVYVSGDNASLDVVRAIRNRIGAVDIAVLFAGAAQTPALPGEYLTITSEQAAHAAGILGASVVLPVHYDSWAHFSEGAEALRAAFTGSPVRLAMGAHGDRQVLWPAV